MVASVRGGSASVAALVLVAGFLGAVPAQAASVSCTASNLATFADCWGSDDADVVITLDGDISLSNRVASSEGKTRTIDLNGNSLTVNGGIQVSASDTLVVDDSSDHGDGTLIANGPGSSAAIGGNVTGSDATPEAGGTFVVAGGSVTAIGSRYAAGVGGGRANSPAGGHGAAGGTVIVNGGTLTATGGDWGVGIGGGISATASSATTGGAGATLTVNGGAVIATGNGGAPGIGGVYADDVVQSGAGVGSGSSKGASGLGSPGSLKVAGLRGASTLLTGGAGGSSTSAPTISFAKSGSKEALVTPVTGAPTGAASVHIRFAAKPKPPAAKKSQKLRPGATPKRIKKRGVTTINKRNAKTREGRPLKARVTVRLTRGEVRCIRIARGAKRLVRARTYGNCKMRIRVLYSAPGNSNLKPLRVVKNYRVAR